MAMDDESFVARWPRRPRPKEILATLSLARISDYFTVEPSGILPESAPVDWTQPEHAAVQVKWGEDLSEPERRRLEAQMLPKAPYRERVEAAKRSEEVMETVHGHIWDAVNAHLGTSAQSFPELVEQLGIMRFGHRPRVADTFCGSGQIPFEAARLGCDVYASDLNPVACMLTWGAFHIVGGSPESREKLERQQQDLVAKVQSEIDKLEVETDGTGWRAKVFLYCVEVRCPESGWMVPLLPTRVVSKGYSVVADLVPDPKNRRYDIRSALMCRPRSWPRLRKAQSARTVVAKTPTSSTPWKGANIAPRFLHCAATSGIRMVQPVTSSACGRGATLSHVRKISFRNGSMPFNGCDPRKKAKASTTSSARLPRTT